MKNGLGKISALALLTSITFASQSAVITYSVETSSTATYFGDTGPIEQSDGASNAIGSTSAVSFAAVFPFAPEEEIGQPIPAFSQNEETNEFDERPIELVPINPLGTATGARAFGDNEFAANATGLGSFNSYSEVLQTYTIETGSISESFVFDFVIDQGFMNAECVFAGDTTGESEAYIDYVSSCPFGDNIGDATVQYEVTVGFGSEVLYSSSAIFSTRVQGSNGQFIDNYLEQNGALFADAQLLGQTYSWGKTENSLDLGTIDANTTTELTYSLRVQASGNTSYFDYETPLTAGSAAVVFGDPNGFSSTKTALKPVTNASAPGSVLLLGFGALALAFIRRRYR